MDDLGHLLFAAEGLPLKTDTSSIDRLTNIGDAFSSDKKHYLLLSRPITDSFGIKVGTIVIPRDVTEDERVIHQHILFNAIVTATAWVLALLFILWYFGSEEWRQRPRASSLELALRDGESQTVEFKKGLPDNALAAAIAAFANTNSGTIFLGVDDNCDVVGVPCDTPERKDQEIQRIRQIATEKIKPSVSITPDFVNYDGKVVLRIFVPRSEHPLCFLDHEIFVRDQNSSARAKPEQVQRILKKFYG
jgi:hypothetical protein